ncbi:FecR domain-containing protein [Nannocystis pusilla]|uniref:FecR domain-containing protein n=1 Tax=Nannocystis pusilla TaxID=889268 RepID=UPI003BF045EF
MFGLAAACVLLALFQMEAPPETREVVLGGDTPFQAGAWISGQDTPIEVELADRSRLIVAPQASMQVVEFDIHRVEVELARGRLEVAIDKNAGIPWYITAGPYTIEAIRATLLVEWRQASAELEVTVDDGDVRVRGGEVGAPGKGVRAGERLVLGGPQPTRPPVASIQAPLALSVDPRCPVGRCAPERPKKTAREKSQAWRQLADAGEHEAALEWVEQRGFRTFVASASAAELDLLAASARFARNADKAEELLNALRRRFPRDPGAARAKFLLGLVALELRKLPRTAAVHFTDYLREHPVGDLAEEARGWMLQIWHSLGESERARASADEYLQLHPNGSHAGLARKLSGTP